MRKEINVELSGRPNQEFAPGAIVVKVGTKFVRYVSRGSEDVCTIEEFYNALIGKKNMFFWNEHR